MKIKILKNFIGNVSGASIRFREGQEVEVNDNDAMQFVRGHYADVLMDKPAVKIKVKPVETGRKANIK